MFTLALTVHNLSITLERQLILDNLSFELTQGSITGLIGPSGSGKTTLMRALVGLQRLSNGNISIFGLPAGSAPLRSQINYMTQQNSVYPDLTVQENIAYFATMAGIPSKDLKSQIAHILKTVDLTNHARQIVKSLSGGQRQRVSLAIALIGQPKLLILDEPTVGLDPVLREELWTLFEKVAARGTTLLISSHVMEEAERCSDLLLLRDGKLLAHDSPEDLRLKTQTHSVEQSFLKLVKEMV